METHPSSSTGMQFNRFARACARATGKPVTFMLAVLIVIVWAISGPVFGFSETWQLVINTGTTIITFLMIFLIQNTQNRESEAMHIKLDELICALDGAKNSLLNSESLSDEDLDRLQEHYETLARLARDKTEARDARTSPQRNSAEGNGQNARA